DKYPEFVRRFNASGRGNFLARIVRKAGSAEFANSFEITLRRMKILYDGFPLPLDDVEGTVLIRTAPVVPLSVPRADWPKARPAPLARPRETIHVVELRDIQARCGPGRLLLSGRREPTPLGQLLSLSVRGYQLPLDADLGAALRGLGLDAVWDTFAPS